jgi:hypothetical protein
LLISTAARLSRREYCYDRREYCYPFKPAFSSAVDQEIEQKMDELAREYYDTNDPEIPEEIYELVRRLKEMEH